MMREQGERRAARLAARQWHREAHEERAETKCLLGEQRVALTLPIAAGVFEPFGLTLRPEVAAISMSGSSILVAVNAVALKRLQLMRP